MKHVYDIAPFPKPRITHQTRFGTAAKRFYAWRDLVKLMGIDLPPQGAAVYFHIQVPKSWPKRKKNKMVGKLHRQKPDLTNLIKALEDSVYTDDSHIAHYAGLAKFWAWQPAIIIITDCRTVTNEKV